MAKSTEPDAQHPTPGWWAWGLSAANAIAGDSIHTHATALSIPLALYDRNRPIHLESGALASHHSPITGKLCIFVHGLGCHEGVWRYRMADATDKVTSYGTQLQDEFGYTPWYVRYNTGRPVAENGRDLAALLEMLAACYPVPVEEIVLIGHSMGGLVMRSACYLATRQGAEWVRQVTQLIYLGTPHTGADLETLAHLATVILHTVPNPITRLIGRIFNLRSAGLKDLRHGFRPVHFGVDAGEPHVQPSVAQPSVAQPSVAQPSAAHWLESARHHFIAGTVGADPSHPLSLVLGDGLVRRGSAVHSRQTEGVHMESCTVPGIHHLELARSPEVYQQIRSWCSGKSG